MYEAESTRICYGGGGGKAMIFVLLLIDSRNDGVNCRETSLGERTPGGGWDK